MLTSGFIIAIGIASRTVPFQRGRVFCIPTVTSTPSIAWRWLTRSRANHRNFKYLKNAYEYAVNTQAYASGGYGPGEWSVPADGSLGRALEIRSDTAEIPCDSWAVFKIARHLQVFTGAAYYADWMESLLYNGIGAALPVLPDGRTFYYADYRLGAATKLYHWDEWPCCSGTYLQAVADYHNLIYLRNNSGLFVNLFVPSEATWNHNGQQVTVRQETQFPETNEVRFTIQSAQPVKLALALRVPDWSSEFKLKLSTRETIQSQKDAAGWMVVEREWQPGDSLMLQLNPELRLCPVDAQHPRRCAVKYGPVLLAQEARFTYPLALRDGKLAEKLKRDGDDLRFVVNDDGGGGQGPGHFVPYYEIPERLPHRVYFDLDAPRFL
ncbi:MAG: glycoside hydrolase family 127 protein [Verrucomicrobiota bacterium]